jgi:transcriptional regulator with XRE-family HTH domain
MPQKRQQRMADMPKMIPTSTESVRLEGPVEAIVGSIGPKVKRLRQEQRLSLQQLAEKAEVSAAAIHKIERNNMVPTITTLLKLATALGRPVTYFVEQAGDQPEPVAFTPAKHRHAVVTPHEGLTLAGISGPYAPFRSAAAVATVAPRADSGDKPLVHSGEELVFMLEGRLVFDIAGKRYEIGAGDALHFVGNQPHHWVNEGKSKARVLWITVPDS